MGDPQLKTSEDVAKAAQALNYGIMPDMDQLGSSAAKTQNQIQES